MATQKSIQKETTADSVSPSLRVWGMRSWFYLGITLWALSHLAVNGDLGSLILFGGFVAYAIFDMWSANRRGADKSDKKLPLYWDLVLIVAGGSAYCAAWLFHPYLFGVAVLP